jgi:hypothetical protein
MSYAQDIEMLVGLHVESVIAIQFNQDWNVMTNFNKTPH